MEVHSLLGTALKKYQSIEDLTSLSTIYRKGLLERHIHFGFLIIPSNVTVLNEIKEEAFVQSLSPSSAKRSEHILTGTLSDWKRTIEYYLLDHKLFSKEKRHLFCKIMFLLENEHGLFAFFKEYRKVKLPDTSFYLIRK